MLVTNITFLCTYSKFSISVSSYNYFTQNYEKLSPQEADYIPN